MMEGVSIERHDLRSPESEGAVAQVERSTLLGTVEHGDEPYVDHGEDVTVASENQCTLVPQAEFISQMVRQGNLLHSAEE